MRIGHLQEARMKREKIEKRLAMNMMMAEKIEEKRKQDFLDKQAHHDQLRAQHLAQQEQERQLHSQVRKRAVLPGRDLFALILIIHRGWNPFLRRSCCRSSGGT